MTESGWGQRATVEFDGHRLVIETKMHDGTGPCDYPPNGQLRALRDEVQLGKVVIVLGECREGDRWEDWRGLPVEERRLRLKAEIDAAQGLTNNDHPRRSR